MVQNDEKMCGSARQKLESIFDAGTFVELGAYTKRLSPENGFEGVVCGYGAVAVIFQDNGVGGNASTTTAGGGAVRRPVCGYGYGFGRHGEGRSSVVGIRNFYVFRGPAAEGMTA